jgi:hypothetical protein
MHQFAFPLRVKFGLGQYLKSGRREQNSNHGYGWPYLFKKSNEFGKLGTRDSCRRADAQVVHRHAMRLPLRGAPIPSSNERMAIVVRVGSDVCGQVSHLAVGIISVMTRPRLLTMSNLEPSSCRGATTMH